MGQRDSSKHGVKQTDRQTDRLTEIDSKKLRAIACFAVMHTPLKATGQVRKSRRQRQGLIRKSR